MGLMDVLHGMATVRADRLSAGDYALRAGSVKLGRQPSGLAAKRLGGAVAGGAAG